MSQCRAEEKLSLPWCSSNFTLVSLTCLRLQQLLKISRDGRVFSERNWWRYFFFFFFPCNTNTNRCVCVRFYLCETSFTHFRWTPWSEASECLWPPEVEWCRCSSLSVSPLWTPGPLSRDAVLGSALSANIYPWFFAIPRLLNFFFFNEK